MNPSHCYILFYYLVSYFHLCVHGHYVCCTNLLSWSHRQWLSGLSGSFLVSCLFLIVIYVHLKNLLTVRSFGLLFMLLLHVVNCVRVKFRICLLHQIKTLKHNLSNMKPLCRNSWQYCFPVKSFVLLCGFNKWFILGLDVRRHVLRTQLRVFKYWRVCVFLKRSDS